MRARLAVNAYAVVHEAVEQALGYGWQRVFKHRDKPEGLPDDATIVNELTGHVMSALSETVDWDRSAVAKGSR